MKRFIYLFFSFFLFISSSCLASEKIFTGSASYIMSNYESEYDAVINALKYAKRDAIEQSGTYIESITKTIGNEVTIDEIKMVTIGVARLIPNSIEKNFESKDEEKFVTLHLKAKFAIDDSLLYQTITSEKNNLKRDLKANELYLQAITKKNEIKERKYKGKERKLKEAEVKELLEAAINTKNDYKDAIIELGNWYNSKVLFNDDNNRLLARELYSKALKITPHDADVYKMIADTFAPSALSLLGDKINDTNNLCNSYVNVNQAIIFYSKAIKTDTSKGIYYMHRGDMYKYLKKYDFAIKDYTNYIEREHDKIALKFAYQTRAYIYYKLNSIEKSLDDIDMAINLKIPKNQWRSFSRQTVNEEYEYRQKMKLLNQLRNIAGGNKLIEEEKTKIVNELKKQTNLLTKYEEGLYDWRINLARRGWRYLWLYSLERNDEYLRRAISDMKNADGERKKYRTDNIFMMTESERQRFFEDLRINDLVGKIIDTNNKNDSIMINSIKNEFGK